MLRPSPNSLKSFDALLMLRRRVTIALLANASLLAAPRPADTNAIEHGVATLRLACAGLDRTGALIVLRDLIPEFTGIVGAGPTTSLTG